MNFTQINKNAGDVHTTLGGNAVPGTATTIADILSSPEGFQYGRGYGAITIWLTAREVEILLKRRDGSKINTLDEEMDGYQLWRLGFIGDNLKISGHGENICRAAEAELRFQQRCQAQK